MHRLHAEIDIEAPVEVCYALWTDFERLPLYLPDIESITPTSQAQRWRWTLRGPFNQPFSYDAQIDLDHPNEYISWHSNNDAPVATAGTVHFQAISSNRSRLVVDMDYVSPAGPVGEFVADLVFDPQALLNENLKQFKAAAEQPPEYLKQEQTTEQPLSDPDQPDIAGEYQTFGISTPEPDNRFKVERF